MSEYTHTLVMIKSKSSYRPGNHFYSTAPWQDKTENPVFDVGMGCHDAECCELVGLYLLSLFKLLNLNIRIYRDDSLGVLCMNLQQAELKKKEICKIFKQNNLSITIEVNLKSVDFFRYNHGSQLWGVMTLHEAKQFPHIHLQTK